ncbi:MAG: fimbrillin family protein [Bacteroidaceae bacterium]|nr:fimbrillin family protein [Bacteroidaceae bacterium]
MKRFYIYNMCKWVALSLPLCGLWGCADHWDDFTPKHEEEQQEIAFTATVVSSRQETRADGSLCDIKETSLPKTDADGNYAVGVFGYYTGQDTWTSSASANFFFNQKMDVKASVDGKNALAYPGDTLKRYWPNGKLDATQYEYASFWAYYPYNESDDPGANGIAIVPSSGKTYGITNGSGMGSIKFTMHTDASEQSDFLISDLVADRSRTTNPVSEGKSTPVSFTFHHMLAQVRLYAYIKPVDKIVYQTDEDGNTELDNEGEPIVDEDKSVCWEKNDEGEIELSYSISFNNIYTTCIFSPTYETGKTKFPSQTVGSASGSATVDNYTANDEGWWTVSGDGDKRMLNTKKMYGDNYARGNIILAVPQTLTDDDVPNVVITVKGKAVKGKDTKGYDCTAKVTVNLLNMGIKWESGFIYSYAFVDELRPDDDLVRGPESITVIFDTNHHTDQW